MCSLMGCSYHISMVQRLLKFGLSRFLNSINNGPHNFVIKCFHYGLRGVYLANTEWCISLYNKLVTIIYLTMPLLYQLWVYTYLSSACALSRTDSSYLKVVCSWRNKKVWSDVMSERQHASLVLWRGGSEGKFNAWTVHNIWQKWENVRDT